MAQINKPNEYFDTLTWTGDNSTRNITDLNFQPDWTWIKHRSFAFDHREFDSVRGASKSLATNSSGAEASPTDELTAFLSNGFTLGNSVTVNGTGYGSGNFVGQNWRAGGTASSNTDGSITSSVSANTTSGFSVVSWTGTGANATVGHGLGTTPKLIFVKATSRVDSWRVYSESIGNTKYLVLNETGASATNSTEWNNTSPTSSVFTVGSSGNVNRSAETFIAYCFAEKKGFSKFGSYVGTGSSTGTPFIYTGFKPAFVMTKISSGTTDDWTMTDIVRDNAVGGGGNGTGARLQANYNGAEAVNTTYASIQKYSNGFSPQGNLNVTNGSGYTYIYMAFAEHPLVGSDGTPVTAR